MATSDTLGPREARRHEPATPTYDTYGTHSVVGVTWRVWVGDAAHAAIYGRRGRILWLSKRLGDRFKAHAALAVELKRRYVDLPPPPVLDYHRKPIIMHTPRKAPVKEFLESWGCE